MILGEKIEWLQQAQLELTNYLLNPDDQKTTLSLEKRVAICKEVSRLQAKIEFLQALPDWALKFEHDDGQTIEIHSGSNLNRQGKPLRTLRKVPKVTRTWSAFH